MSPENWIILLKRENFFEYFTLLINSKLSGGLVSVKPPKDFDVQLSFLLTIKYGFECPYCENLIQIEELTDQYNCDCGLKIDLNKVEYEKRYILNSKFFEKIQNFLKQDFSFGYFKYKIIFGERRKRELIHNSKIYVHITPKNLWTQEIKLIDEKYVDNFALGWKYFLNLFNSKKRIEIFSKLEDIRESFLTDELYNKENEFLFLKENSINFIHISDFHIKGNASDNEKELIIDRMIYDLKNRRLKDNIVDFILITGDITYSAKWEQFEKVNSILIEKLEDPIEGLNIERKNIFMVPGNHDINRDFFDKEIFDNLTKDYNEGTLKKYWYNGDKGSRLCLNFKKLENFQLFQKDILKQENIEKDKLYIYRIYEKLGYKIGILGLNTPWVGGDDEEKGKLLMSKYQIIDAFTKNYLSQNYNLNIAFFHHPIESLNEEEQDEIRAHIYNHFDLVFFGHRHETNYSINNDYNTETHLIRAGPIYKTNKKIRGSYNLIQIDVKNNKGRIIFRRPHKNNPELYVYDNEASPKEEFLENNGTFNF